MSSVFALEPYKSAALITSHSSTFSSSRLAGCRPCLVEMKNASTIMCEDNKAIHHAQLNAWRSKEIDRYQLTDVISKKCTLAGNRQRLHCCNFIKRASLPTTMLLHIHGEPPL